MPRKKKHPELAYRAHEFIMSEGSDDSLDSTVGFDRARVSTSAEFCACVAHIPIFILNAPTNCLDPILYRECAPPQHPLCRV